MGGFFKSFSLTRAPIILDTTPNGQASYSIQEVPLLEINKVSDILRNGSDKKDRALINSKQIA